MLAQHEHHAPPSPTPAPDEASLHLFQSDMSLMTGMTPRDPEAEAPMAEMPDMPGMAAMASGGWHVMDLGVVRLSFNRQGGASGGSEIESSNWNMIHAGRRLGPGRLSLMMMNSLEPATYPKRGSRELFQTGESFHGEPLVDRQHPHDFFMNLSATYRLDLGRDAGAWIQAAPVGEPALGPVAFMHRASAGDNPTAPLGHHWQDSTHIAFNVVTAGGGWKWIALEGSVFHGREPDEHRWNIEGGAIDSASLRAKVTLGRWSGELSHGFLKSPEALEPGNTHRTTASVGWGADGGGPFAVSLVWGRNDEAHGTSDAWLLEGAWRLTRRDAIYARAELVEKDRELLATKALPPESETGADFARIGACTAGYARDFDVTPVLKTALAADVTAYRFPSSLDAAYGRHPISLHVFLRVRWGSDHGAGHHGAGGQGDHAE